MGHLDILLVPIDEGLEAACHRLVLSGPILVRESAVDSLTYFKSDANRKILEKLLNDPQFLLASNPAIDNGIEVRRFDVREHAYAVLRGWGPSPRKPVLTSSVSKLRSVPDLLLTGPITDRMMKDLSKNVHLASLQIFTTTLTDYQISLLGKLKNVRLVWIQDVNVDDAGVRSLAKLTTVEDIQITKGTVTDEGLMELSQVMSLKRLALTPMHITNRGIKQFRAARSDVNLDVFAPNN